MRFAVSSWRHIPVFSRYVVALKTALNSIISFYLKMLRHVKVLGVMLARYVQ
jgi:hypothetical protein